METARCIQPAHSTPDRRIGPAPRARRSRPPAPLPPSPITSFFSAGTEKKISSTNNDRASDRQFRTSPITSASPDSASRSVNATKPLNRNPDAAETPDDSAARAPPVPHRQSAHFASPCPLDSGCTPSCRQTARRMHSMNVVNSTISGHHNTRDRNPAGQIQASRTAADPRSASPGPSSSVHAVRYDSEWARRVHTNA